MSDFVQRQVSRAAGKLGPEIRPRLPSVFEPARLEERGSEPFPLDAEGDADVDGATEQRPNSPGVPLPAPRRRAGDSQPASGPVDFEGGPGRTTARAAARGLRAHERGGLLPAVDEQSAPDAAADGAMVPDPQATRRPPRLLPPDPPAELPAAHQVRAREPAAPPMLSPPATLPAAMRALQAIRTRASLAGDGPGRPDMAETLDGAPDGPLLAPPHAPAGVRVRSRGPSDHPGRHLAAETAIEVTIGRIEVRAAPAPAASARPSRSPAPRQPSDLELYLRQKGSGRS